MQRCEQLIWLVLSLALAGCASVPDFVEQGRKANVAVEQSSNTTLLLNVVRAYQRHPMHFTSISSVKGPIGDGSAGFTVGLPALGADRAFNGRRALTPAVTYKVDTTAFDVTVWDGQDFMRGITTPIEPRNLVYYLDQGWHLPMLMHLLVREVREVGPEGQVLKRWTNYPGNPEEFKKFQGFVNALYGCQLRGEDAEATALSGPIPIHDLSASDSLAGIAAIKAQGLGLTRSADGRSMVVTSKGGPVSLEPIGSCALNAENSEGKPKEFAFAFAGGFRVQATPAKSQGATAKRHLEIQLRSPEAAIYYMGELVRAQLGDPLHADRVGGDPATIDINGRPEPLVVVKREPVPVGTTPALRTTFEDRDYWVPAGKDGGRTMHAFALVQMLVNSQKNAKDLPTSNSIRLLAP
jgi:hypothetical protein